jgi:hypothetical protein
VSGSGGILSGHGLGEPLSGPTEPEAGGIHRDVEDWSDFPRLQLLPCPETKDLLVFGGEREEGVLQLRIGLSFPVIGGEGRSRLRLHPLQQPEVTALTPSLVGEHPSGDPVAPGEWEVLWHIVETPPNDEQHFAESIFGVGRARASTQVTLERLEHLFGHCLESQATVAL